MKNESGIILSIPQLRLCADTLTGKRWDDLPLLDTGEPLEQRLLNAFLKLIQAGYFLPEADGFAPTDEFAEIIACVSLPEKAFRLWEGERIAAFLYEKAGLLAVIAPDAGNPEHCRVTCYTGMTPEEAVKEQFPEHEKLRLMQVQEADRQRDQSKPEKLALFFGATKKTEEAQ